ncbi:glycoside hydrolase family 61 protein I [Flammula alnicola]|nr:glycoside hydrolase family 61 protein I [Flammula alnicola]
MKLSHSIASAIFLASSVSAHTIFQQLYVNGVSPGHIVGIRVPDYDGPITDVTSNDLICNGGINPYHQPISTAIIPVPAGAQVTAEFHHTLTSAGTGDPADPIDPSHKGPIIAYLAQINNATQTSVTGLNWFKIYEDGLDSGTTGLWTNLSPTWLYCAGQYLLRVEIIALHAASTYPGAQLYMECAQIQITGGGSTSPATVSFPGAYKSSDPGITYNLYSGQTSYTIPGPSVFSCSGQGSSVTTSPATTSQPATASVPISSSSSASAPATPSTAAGTVAHYAQCGGTGWTGGTVCVAPFTCTFSSAYYSQCL